MKKIIIQPAAPVSMEVILTYVCPHCQHTLSTVASSQPGLLQCLYCGGQFPIIPADAKTLQFLQLILAGGNAIVNPDFM